MSFQSIFLFRLLIFLTAFNFILFLHFRVLTAAHCVRKRLYVRLGEHNIQSHDGTEVELKIEYAIKHPKYDKKTVDNDVALLRYT